MSKDNIENSRGSILITAQTECGLIQQCTVSYFFFLKKKAFHHYRYNAEFSEYTNRYKNYFVFEEDMASFSAYEVGV